MPATREDPAERELPKFERLRPEKPGFRGPLLEAMGSTIWTVLFLSYFSRALTSSWGHGASAWATVPLVALPVVCAGLPGALEGRAGARGALCAHVLYAVLPGAVLLAWPRSLGAHFAAAALLHVPLAAGALPRGLSATGDVSAWDTLSAALVALNAFSVVAPLARPVGFSFRGAAAAAPTAAACAALALLAGLLVASASGFARFARPRPLHPPTEAAVAVGLYLSALCEEVLFRGVLLNLLLQWLPGNAPVAIALSSLAFAAAHVRKEKHGFRAPNWRFAATAGTFGVFCGIAWTASERVPVSAFVNAVFHYTLRTLLKKRSTE